MPVLYDYELDPEAYKVRLLLAVLGVPYEKLAVDVYPGEEHLGAAFLALNPEGTLPVLIDGDQTLYQAESVLAYVARKHDAAGTWMPDSARELAETSRWLAFASSTLAPAIAAREAALFGGPGDMTSLVAQTRQALRLMEDHMTHRMLAGEAWFAAGHPTIADLALFPGFALSRDFGVDHAEYPALRRWLRAVRDIEGFIPMPGVPGYH